MLQRELTDPSPFDLVVIGAGGAGLSAAAAGGVFGARVLVVEQQAQIGGTTAWSAGTTWVPGTHLAAEVDADDTPAAAARFLDLAVGAHAPRALREALLAHGADAVATMTRHTHLQFRARSFHPDYLSELEGSTRCGRALEPLPFDGRRLGPLLALVRPPMPEFTVLGGMAIDRDDIPHLLGFTRSIRSSAYVARIVLRHVLDRARFGRGTRLLMGNALVGRLLLTLHEQGASLLTEARITQLEQGPQGITGVVLQHASRTWRVGVRGGVLLAGGGFNRHPQRRSDWLPGIPEDWCAGAPGPTGGTQDLALAAGATFGQGQLSPAYWAPVSLRRRADGSTAVFPHFVFDRAKPGTVVVDGGGRRFVNESTSYHLFGLAQQAARATRKAVPCFLVTDARGLWKYGLGQVRPRERRLAPYLADGYLVRGETLATLAQALGIDADGLQETVRRLNEHAASGVDPDFQRGTTVYQRANGDATWGGPNPTLGPIGHAPFYAVRLLPGDIGAARGLVTDASARVLDAQGRVIDGLYAIGNDMQSVMGGVYPAPGITLGPGLVFGFLAARDAARRAGIPADPSSA